jgi:hypothetical protein
MKSVFGLQMNYFTNSNIRVSNYVMGETKQKEWHKSRKEMESRRTKQRIEEIFSASSIPLVLFG